MSNETTKKQKNELGPVLKMVLELGPLAVFFFANARGEQLSESYPFLKALGDPIFIATAAFMVAMAISLTVSYILIRRMPMMPLITGFIVFIFGGLTLYLHDETFIKMKPTIVNSIFAGGLFIGLACGKSLLKHVFDGAFRVTDKGWNILTWRWAFYFVFLAVANEVVWRSFSTDFWVTFKVWAVMPMTMVFAMFQMSVMMKHQPPEELDPSPAE